MFLLVYKISFCKHGIFNRADNLVLYMLVVALNNDLEAITMVSLRLKQTNELQNIRLCYWKWAA